MKTKISTIVLWVLVTIAIIFIPISTYIQDARRKDFIKQVAETITSDLKAIREERLNKNVTPDQKTIPSTPEKDNKQEANVIISSDETIKNLSDEVNSLKEKVSNIVIDNNQLNMLIIEKTEKTDKKLSMSIDEIKKINNAMHQYDTKITTVSEDVEGIQLTASEIVKNIDAMAQKLGKARDEFLSKIETVDAKAEEAKFRAEEAISKATEANAKAEEVNTKLTEYIERVDSENRLIHYNYDVVLEIQRQDEKKRQ